MVSFDYLGYGKSDGKRGYLSSPSTLGTQAYKFIHLLQDYYGLEHGISLNKSDVPLFLAG